MAACDEDIVVLNVRTDHYSCLAEAAEHLAVDGAGVDGPEPLIEDLVSASLLSLTPGADRTDLPPLPTRALPYWTTRPSVADRWTVVRALLASWRAGSGRHPLERLLDDVPTPPNREPRLETISRLTAGFADLLPWDPTQGACLYRAWLLRRILQSRQQHVVWVFGVKTWPFGAHCWLQVGEYVLDDDPDRVALYKPIMAV
ncbi:MAG: lasso peptide biosynthesis B2 protein [Brevundimonas sp.]|uniref:lasso peptide biosynthesis B2 protein n=1 Tax=Brevundimonas sp. TaxID=1871086 RepID=UPI0025883D2E|nr:lasso peptide biosynthesis B2 protein [Brevundimonas sp.]MCV0415710.1 lasso peptide biosynthesis B2 protein [Brevundimonas sp.]